MAALGVVRIIALSVVLTFWSKLTNSTQVLDQDDHSYFKNLPCPNAEDIAPCVCEYYEENMNMLCYNIADEEQLHNIFNGRLPFHNFYSLHFDTRNLQTLGDDVFGNATFEWVHACIGDQCNNYDYLYNGTYGSLSSISPKTFIKSASTLKYLDLFYNQVSTFPFETLGHYTSLSYLSMYGSQISNLPTIGSPSLLWLDLGFGSFDYIRPDALNHLPKLNGLSLCGNPLSSFPILQSATLETLELCNGTYEAIPSGALDGLPNLLNFVSAYTNITSMATGLFGNLPRLDQIIMPYSGLRHLKTSQFEMSSPISNLELTGNQITSIEVGAIKVTEDIYGVALIDLRNNSLTTLPEETWRPIIDNRNIVLLEGNSLDCGCDIAWFMLNDQPDWWIFSFPNATCYSGEYIADLDPGIYEDWLFGNLPHLDHIIMPYSGLRHLKTSQFEMISTTLTYYDNVVLELSGNQITSIEVDAIKVLFKVEDYGDVIIDLRNNSLTTLPEETWKPMVDNHNIVLLEGNSLDCGCDIAWLVLNDQPDWGLASFPNATCYSGEYIADLDPGIYEDCE